MDVDRIHRVKTVADGAAIELSDAVGNREQIRIPARLFYDWVLAALELGGAAGRESTGFLNAIAFRCGRHGDHVVLQLRLVEGQLVAFKVTPKDARGLAAQLLAQARFDESAG